MKKISRIFILFLVTVVLTFNFALAEVLNDEKVITNSNSETSNTKDLPFTIQNNTNIDAQKIEDSIENAVDKGESLAYKIIAQISDKSLPICVILILWGAVLYFILGIRNLYKKRQGLLLMWGAFTFLVIAKIVNFICWFAFMR